MSKLILDYISFNLNKGTLEGPFRNYVTPAKLSRDLKVEEPQVFETLDKLSSLGLLIKSDEVFHVAVPKFMRSAV